MRLLLSSMAMMLALTAGFSRDPRPNIIVFLVDDYDKEETSVYGGKVLTPNLERLAREGITFDNAHVTSTVHCIKLQTYFWLYKTSFTASTISFVDAHLLIPFPIPFCSILVKTSPWNEFVNK